MKRQTTIFKFFAKKQKDDGDLNDFCTHDSQKQNTNIEESIVTNEEKENKTLLSMVANITALATFKLLMLENLVTGLQSKEMTTTW